MPVDAIGFQCHFELNQVPDTLQQNLQRFADLGLDVAITELDINTGTPNASDTLLQQQAENYWTVVNACVQTNRCVSVVSTKRLLNCWSQYMNDRFVSQSVWGVSDDHSWIPNGSVLPWNAEKQPKPAFYAIADAFEGKAYTEN